MGWITDGLDQADYDRNYSDWVLFKRIIHYFSSYKLLIIILSLAITADAFINAFIPVLLSELIAILTDNQLTPEIQELMQIIGAFFVLSFVMIAIREIFTAKAVQGAIRDLRRDTFKSLIRRDFQFL